MRVHSGGLVRIPRLTVVAKQARIPEGAILSALVTLLLGVLILVALVLGVALLAIACSGLRQARRLRKEPLLGHVSENRPAPNEAKMLIGKRWPTSKRHTNELAMPAKRQAYSQLARNAAEANEVGSHGSALLAAAFLGSSVPAFLASFATEPTEIETGSLVAAVLAGLIFVGSYILKMRSVDFHTMAGFYSSYTREKAWPELKDIDTNVGEVSPDAS